MIADILIFICIFLAYFMGYFFGQYAARQTQAELLRSLHYDFEKDKREFDAWLEKRLEALKRQKP